MGAPGERRLLVGARRRTARREVAFLKDLQRILPLEVANANVQYPALISP